MISQQSILLNIFDMLKLETNNSLFLSKKSIKFNLTNGKEIIISVKK